jgi:cytochrome c nitrite reductase small subunit
LVALVAIVTFVMFGPPNYIETFAQPEFCASCHVMNPQYAAFQSSSHGRRLESCNDCHLPNDSFVRHYFWEGVVGVRDLVEFNLNLIPEHITARERSKDWVEENCRRCHDEVIARIHPDEQGRCWDCHRELYHDFETRFDPEQRRPIWQDEE